MGSIRLYRSLKIERVSVQIQFVTDAGNTFNTGSRRIFIGSQINQSIHVDWGDGTGSDIDIVANVLTALQHDYSSPFGEGVDKVISITPASPAEISKFQIVSLPVKGDFPTGLEQCNNLQNMLLLATGNSLENFPFAMLNITSFVELQFNNVFATGTPFNTTIPLVLFNKPLTTLFYVEGLTNDFENNNMNLIVSLNSTLQSLELGGGGPALTKIPDDMLYGFQNLTNLVHLGYVNCSLGDLSLQPVISQLSPTLKTLNFNSAQITGYGDFSQLVNLESLHINQGNANLTTSFPGWFSALTKLKMLNFQSAFRTTLRIDAFIDNFYNFVVANASMTAGNTSFRHMTVLVNILGAPPSGTYQEPSGFSLGTNNGAPASPREKIWVLVNQYAHVWNYNS